MEPAKNRMLTGTIQKVIAVNDRGFPIGEDHPNAKLTNAEVDQLLALHDDEGWGYSRLSETFEISRSQARNIVLGRKRCQTIDRFRTVHLVDGE